jgi:hypothetical protein
MVTIIEKRTVVIAGMVAVLIVLAVLPGCKKQSEPGGSSESRPAEPKTEKAVSEPVAQQPAVTGSGKGFRILYAGRPGSDREKDFVSFLRKHFDVVQTGNLETFKEAETQGFDVTLLDWDAGGLKGRPCPEVSESFSRPVVTIGVPGAEICSQWRLKTGYL